MLVFMCEMQPYLV